MKSTFVLVADNVRARIFTAETPSSPLEKSKPWLIRKVVYMIGK